LRYLTADYIFPISQPPIKNGIVAVDDDGRIFGVHSPKSDVGSFLDIGLRSSDIQHFNGILCPGFVNTHCHLELSHMKDVIPEKTGLTGFIKHFIAARKTFSHEQINNGIAAAEKEMVENGIVAVGDICNVADTFKQKAKKNLKYYSFIEGFDFFPENTEVELNRVDNVIKELIRIDALADYSAVPHAPYSVSEKYFQTFSKILSDKIISIHNQESADENLMFREKSGKIIEFFISLGMNFSNWKASGKNSLESYLTFLPKANNLLLVHNTFTNSDDIKFAEAYSNNIYWATCPNANLYIENKLPDYNIFIAAGAKMAIGTDSLASNYSLSILDELKTISSYFPELKLEMLLQWATLNGAKALNFQDELGSFEVGKNPGVLLIENVDLQKFHLKENSRVKRLV
jgi:cytosine/adenosine deaminase-related metal-dependent hydrolase